jgi:hypothetical protein
MFQIVVVCTLSVFISVFAESEISVAIPKSNDLVYTNKSWPDNYTVYGNYTGLRAATFRMNLYGRYSAGVKDEDDENDVKKKP